MARKHEYHDSDTEFSPEDDFNFSDDNDLLDLDKGTNSTDEQLPNNPTQLFSGNAYPPEYYQNSVQQFNPESYNNEDYSKGSRILINSRRENWHEYIHLISFLAP
jgi:hypothetical protein